MISDRAAFNSIINVVVPSPSKLSCTVTAFIINLPIGWSTLIDSSIEHPLLVMRAELIDETKIVSLAIHPKELETVEVKT